MPNERTYRGLPVIIEGAMETPSRYPKDYDFVAHAKAAVREARNFIYDCYGFRVAARKWAPRVRFHDPELLEVVFQRKQGASATFRIHNIEWDSKHQQIVRALTDLH